MRAEVFLEQSEPLLRFLLVPFRILQKTSIGVAQRRTHVNEPYGGTRRNHTDGNLRGVETERTEVRGDDHILRQRIHAGLDGQDRRIAELQQTQYRLAAKRASKDGVPTATHDDHARVDAARIVDDFMQWFSHAHAHGPRCRRWNGARHLSRDHRLASLHEIRLRQHRIRDRIKGIHRHRVRSQRAHHLNRCVQRRGEQVRHGERGIGGRRRIGGDENRARWGDRRFEGVQNLSRAANVRRLVWH